MKLTHVITRLDMRWRTRWWSWHVATLLLLGVLALSFAWLSPLWLRGPAPAYALVAELTRAGQFGARLYDDAWFSAQVLARTHGAVSDIFSPDLPTLAILLLPLAFAPPALLPALWTLGNALALWLATQVPLALTRLHPLNAAVWLAIVTVALFSPPQREDLAQGQLYLWVLLLHAVVLWSVSARRDALGGVALGLLWTLKLTGLPLWLVLLALRRWRTLSSASLTVGALVLVALALDADVWRTYLLRVLPAWLAHPVATVPAYQTLRCRSRSNTIISCCSCRLACWRPVSTRSTPQRG